MTWLVLLNKGVLEHVCERTEHANWKHVNRWNCFWRGTTRFLDERESTWKSRASTCSGSLNYTLNCDGATHLSLVYTPAAVLLFYSPRQGASASHRAGWTETHTFRLNHRPSCYRYSLQQTSRLTWPVNESLFCLSSSLIPSSFSRYAVSCLVSPDLVELRRHCPTPSPNNTWRGGRHVVSFPVPGETNWKNLEHAPAETEFSTCL